MPSDFTGYFTQVETVAQDQEVYSLQANKVARTLNERILSGLGDVHWRSLWAAFSLVRNFRTNDGGTPPLYPPEDEWWQYYGLLKETVWDWPTAAVSDPEGLSTECPIVQYFYGLGSLPSEKDRTDDCPLREYLGAPVPSTPLQAWDLGKVQRGAITSADLTDFTYAPAMFVPRVTDEFNSLVIGSLDLRHKTAGGKIDDSTSDYIREKGQQWNQMREQFLNEWRGTDDEREDAGDWDPAELTADYETMLASQYFLAPAYGEGTGSGGATEAIYPLFEWPTGSGIGTLGLYTKPDLTDTQTITNHTDFVFAGVIVVGENLTGDRRIAVKLDDVTIETITVNGTTDEVSVWWPTAKTGTLKFELLDGITGTEDVWVEVAELMDHTPELIDLFLFFRLATARSSSPTIYRGKIVSDAKDISDAYFVNGCAVNGSATFVPQETKIAKFAPYQAVRDFLIRFFRIINYDRLKGYYVNGDGNSVLIFDRRGLGSADADIFQDLAPRAEEQTQIQKDVLYRVKASGASPSGEIGYDGSDYKEDETFRGTEVQDLDFTGATDLAVYEESFLIDITDIPKEGRSNEWVLSIGGATVYKDTSGATYKPESYGDIYGAFHDRCHTFSHAWDASTGSTAGKQMGKYSSGTTSGQTIVTRTETPPGHRYDNDEVPYYSVGQFVNDLIDTAEDPLGTSDCLNSIFNEYQTGGVQVSDLDEDWCEGITQHYRSCKVFKAPYLIKSLAIESSDDNLVEVELDGRLEKNDTAPASIADTSASRATYLSTDTEGRSDENTVVGLLRWKLDGVNDPTRIGDISPNAQSPSDYDSSDSDGAVLCRFFLQRLVPWVYDDADTTVEPDEDTKPIANFWQYIEFVIRAGIGGFLDEQKVIDTLEYHATGGGPSGSSSYCDNQDSRDLTMERVLTLAGSSDDTFCLRYSGQSRGGHGPLPSTCMISDQYNEIAGVLNLMKAARFGVPLYLQYRVMTYWDYYDTNDIEYIEGFAIVRSQAYLKPTTLRSTGTWLQGALPYGDPGQAYMSIRSDGGVDKLFMYWSEVQWRVRPHPKILEAVPLALRSYVDTGGAVGTPVVLQPPTLVRCDLDRDPIPADTAVEDFTTLVNVSVPAEECDIGTSGTQAPVTPPTGAIAIANTASSGIGDAESYSDTNIGIETIGEAYVQVPVV